MSRRPASGLPGADSSRNLPPVDEEKTKGRKWNGYVCPGCRTVFRVAADFIGADVMCPSCKETLRLPKTPEDVRPHTVRPEIPTPAAAASNPTNHAKLAKSTKPTRPADLTQETGPSARRTMPTTAIRRLKLTLALLLPLTVIAGVLLLLPPKESTPDKAVLDNAPLVRPEITPQEKQAPPPPPIAVSEMPIPAPSAMPESEEPPVPESAVVQPVPEPVALTAEPATEPLESAPEIPEPVSAAETLETGLVEAIPATAEPAPEQPAAPAAPAAVRPEPETAAAPAKLVHTVVRGDTLTKLSRKYRVTPQQIMQANGMKNDVVRLGRKLVIPAATP